MSDTNEALRLQEKTIRELNAEVTELRRDCIRLADRERELREALLKHDICPDCFGQFSGKHCFTQAGEKKI